MAKRRKRPDYEVVKIVLPPAIRQWLIVESRAVGMIGRDLVQHMLFRLWDDSTPEEQSQYKATISPEEWQRLGITP
jgi:hypothetical protein